jgi:hypothetical protein
MKLSPHLHLLGVQKYMDLYLYNLVRLHDLILKQGQLVYIYTLHI